MTLMETLVAKPPPVHMDKDGVLRVGRTRVRLETVVWAYNHGATPEEIVERYPAVALPDVHAVIAYYLRNRPEVDIYVEESLRLSEEARREAESLWPPDGVMDRLRSRLAQP